MKAWKLYDFNDLRLDEEPMPDVRDGWVLVKLKVFQPSVTEVMRINGFGVEGLEKVKARLKEHGPSQMFGHEFSGRVVDTGNYVKNLKIGDLVSLRTVRGPCGLCEDCRGGRSEDCQNFQWIGIDYPGCFAEYVAVPETIVRKVPDSLSPHEAACLQPLSSVIATVDNAGIKLGDTVCILGTGVLGGNAAQIARINGAGKIICCDINDTNLEWARSMGFDVVVDSKVDDIVDIVKEETGGLGADVTFECAGGNPAQGLSGSKTLGQAFELCRKGGTIMQLAHVMPGYEVPFELKVLRKMGIRYIGHLGAKDIHFYYGINKILTKQIDVRKGITHILDGIEQLPKAVEITGQKGKYRAINPAQVVVHKD